MSWVRHSFSIGDSLVGIWRLGICRVWEFWGRLSGKNSNPTESGDWGPFFYAEKICSSWSGVGSLLSSSPPTSIVDGAMTASGVRKATPLTNDVVFDTATKPWVRGSLKWTATTLTTLMTTRLVQAWFAQIFGVGKGWDNLEKWGV